MWLTYFFLNKVGFNSGPWGWGGGGGGGGGGGYTEMLCPKIHTSVCVLLKAFHFFSSVINQVIEDHVEDGKVGTSRLVPIVPDINK